MKFIVNGETQETERRSISYAAVVAISGLTPAAREWRESVLGVRLPASGFIPLVVRWSNGPDGRAGVMRDGQYVTLAEGMIFDVVRPA